MLACWLACLLLLGLSLVNLLHFVGFGTVLCHSGSCFASTGDLLGSFGMPSGAILEALKSSGMPLGSILLALGLSGALPGDFCEPLVPFGVIWAGHGGREGAKMNSHAGGSAALVGWPKHDNQQGEVQNTSQVGGKVKPLGGGAGGPKYQPSGW